MKFRDSLYDDSEPDYAPCLQRIRGKAVWRAPRRYVQAGWTTPNVKLDDEADIPARCRELTRDLVDWFYGTDKTTEPGTWGHLINRYRTDQFSRYQAVAHTTRHEYEKLLSKWMTSIGTVRLADTHFVDIMTWYTTARAPSTRRPEAGERITEAHKMMTMMRGLVSHGVKIEMKDCTRLKAILSECTFESRSPRRVYPTREEVDTLVARAVGDNVLSFAIGYRMQFDLGLRGNDVIGVWEGPRWVGGVTWDMIDLPGRRLDKVIRKTRRHNDAVQTWDLSFTPELVALLEMLPADRRVGPVIVCEATGKPYQAGHWSRTFGRFRDLCGIRQELQCRDARAGAITEAEGMGARLETLQKFAGHADSRTTSLYTRDDAVASILELRSRRHTA